MLENVRVPRYYKPLIKTLFDCIFFQYKCCCCTICLFEPAMVYSIHDHISYILEVCSKRCSDFFFDWKETITKLYFLQINKQYRYIVVTKKFTLKNIVSGCAVCSEHHIDILNVKSVGKEHLTPSFITESFIEKTVSFWDSVKKFKRSHQRSSIKKLFLKISQHSQEKNLWWSLFL